MAARAAVAVLPPPDDPPTPDEEGYEAARAELDGAQAEVARVQAVLDAARSARERAAAAVERSGDLTGEGDCPLCGQALGDAFEAVQAHRAAELAAAEVALVEAELDRRRAGFAASVAAEAANALLIDLRLARDAWKAYEATRARRSEAEAALARAEAAHGEEVAEGFVAALAAEVDRRRQAADECQRIAGRLERRVTAKAELDVERAAADESKGRLDNLRAKAQRPRVPARSGGPGGGPARPAPGRGRRGRPGRGPGPGGGRPGPGQGRRRGPPAGRGPRAARPAGRPGRRRPPPQPPGRHAQRLPQRAGGVGGAPAVGEGGGPVRRAHRPRVRRARSSTRRPTRSNCGTRGCCTG